MKALLGLVFLLFPILSAADVVVPVASVDFFVNIRISPEAGTEVVGRLHKGDRLAYVRTVDDWLEVELPGDGTGYVHGDWANIVEEAAAEETAVAFSGSLPIATPEPEPVADDPTVKEPIEEPIVEEVAPAVEATVVGGGSESIEAPEPVIEPTPVVSAAMTKSPIKGRRDFLIRFKDEASGTSSQVFDDGNFVGIGTTEPQQRLEVNGSIQIYDQNSGVAGLMITQSSGDTGYILHNRASTLTIGAGSVDRMTIDRDGNVGIGVARPEHPLQMANGAHVTAGGVWANSSSRQRKQNIADLGVEEAIQALIALEPVSFKYINDQRETYLGFIAEDVPDIVATDDRQSLSTMDIVAVLTKVVQDQQQRIAELETKLAQRD